MYRLKNKYTISKSVQKLQYKPSLLSFIHKSTNRSLIWTIDNIFQSQAKKKKRTKNDMKSIEKKKRERKGARTGQADKLLYPIRGVRLILSLFFLAKRVFVLGTTAYRSSLAHCSLGNRTHRREKKKHFSLFQDLIAYRSNNRSILNR